MSSGKTMKKIKENINYGHLITIGIFLLGTIASGVTMYYTVKFTGQNNSMEIKELNSQVKQVNTRLENLDDIYVRQKEFDNFRNNITNKLDNIDENVNYLIRLQIDKSQSPSP